VGKLRYSEPRARTSCCRGEARPLSEKSRWPASPLDGVAGLLSDLFMAFGVANSGGYPGLSVQESLPNSSPGV